MERGRSHTNTSAFSASMHRSSASQSCPMDWLSDPLCRWQGRRGAHVAVWTTSS